MKEKEYREPPEYLAARAAEEEEARKAVEAAEGAATDEETVEVEEVDVGSVRVRIPHGLRPVYKKFMESVMPKIMRTVSDELSSMLCGFGDALKESEKGGTK